MFRCFFPGSGWGKGEGIRAGGGSGPEFSLKERGKTVRGGGGGRGARTGAGRVSPDGGGVEYSFKG